MKLTGFVVSGAIAALAGTMLTYQLGLVQHAATASVAFSITWLANAVVAGITSIVGPIIGALFFGLYPELSKSAVSASNISTPPRSSSAVLLIVIMAINPEGLASMGRFVRSRATAHAGDDDVADLDGDRGGGHGRAARRGAGGAAVTHDRADPQHLRRRLRFGGVAALDGVNFDVPAGADHRRHRAQRRRQDHAVRLHLGLPPARRRVDRAARRRRRRRAHTARRPTSATRARRGPHVPERPPVPVDADPRHPSHRPARPHGALGVLPLGHRHWRRRAPTSRKPRPRADEVARARRADGSRRQAGARSCRPACCGCASWPPSSPCARACCCSTSRRRASPRRRPRRWRRCCKRLAAYLGATLLLIEHDMPLIMGISDTIVAMAAGKVITMRHARRGAQPPRGARRRTWEPRHDAADLILEAHKHRPALRPGAGAVRRVDLGRARRVRRPARHQRRRQVDVPQGGVEPVAVSAGTHRVRRPTTSPRLPPDRITALGLAHVPGGRGACPTSPWRRTSVSAATCCGRGPPSWPRARPRPTRCSRGWASAAGSWRARCRAASSRCWPSPGRSSLRPTMLMVDELSLGPGADRSWTSSWAC